VLTCLTVDRHDSIMGNGWDVGLVTERSLVLHLAVSLHVMTLASCSHTCACGIQVTQRASEAGTPHDAL